MIAARMAGRDKVQKKPRKEKIDETNLGRSRKVPGVQDV
jgi:hypothetical protein